MVAWWEAMNLVEQIFAIVGIASTLLLVIQVILLIAGFSGGSDADVDTGGDIDTDAGGADIHGDFDAHAGDVSMEMPDIEIDVHPGDWYGPADGTPHEGFVVDSPLEASAATGLHLFTMQGLITFFAVFGWSGLAMMKSGVITVGAVALSIAFGLAAMFLVALLFRAMLRLQQDGTMDIRNALGKSGTVYMNIPANREQTGKVNIVIQEQLMELDAVTDEDCPIKTGSEVTVIGISNGNSLIVRKK